MESTLPSINYEDIKDDVLAIVEAPEDDLKFLSAYRFQAVLNNKELRYKLAELLRLLYRHGADYQEAKGFFIKNFTVENAVDMKKYLRKFSLEKYGLVGEFQKTNNDLGRLSRQKSMDMEYEAWESLIENNPNFFQNLAWRKNLFFIFCKLLKSNAQIPIEEPRGGGVAYSFI